MLRAMVAVFAVGCSGLDVGSGSSAVDTNPQPPTPNPPWCADCPEGAVAGRARALDPVIQRRVQDEVRSDPSLPIKCDQIWPNQLEELVRMRVLLVELWQVAPPDLKPIYNQEIIRVDNQMAILERYLSTCP